MNKAIRIIPVLILVFAAACSTEKNTSMSRNYHNLVSHYNIYFNGSESFKKGINQAGKSIQDNYTRILPLFYYSDEQISQSITPAMNRAIEKATKVITLHSITAKPEIKRGNLTEKQKEFYNKKEFNKWVDDNYILMGKSYVYENKFKLAVETFKKVVTDFPEEPIRYEALIWMARAYNELGEYRESQNILQMIGNDEGMPQEYRGAFNTTFADLLIKQERYEQAIPYLEKGLNETRKKSRRIRYTFILAQLYQATGNSEKAVGSYQKVIRMNPPYEMTFNAKINMARSYKAGSGREKEILTTLRKMLKDEKNKDYQDQIYYALGKIAMKEGDTATAIDNFKQSAATSVDNYNQKGLSYLELGDIYYERPDYPLAQAYYDSTIQNVDKDLDEYELLAVKSRSLTNLVKHLDVYTLEDSLQILAKLPENMRLQRIDKIIENVKKKEEEERLRKQEETQNAQYGSLSSPMRSGTGVGGQGGTGSAKWYFYNLNAKGFGQPEFRMRWGNRKLEDNWRRSNKQTIDISEQNQVAEAGDSATENKTAIFSNKSREFYLKDIPLTDSALAVSDKRMENALYNMGLVYRNELKDTKEAVKTFGEQVRRFPDGPNSLMGYFNLYEINNLEGNQQKANYYKDLIIRKYPNNPRAKILANPSYVEELMSEQNKVLDLYEKTYQEYEDNKYSEVIRDADFAIKTFPGDKTIPRFRLLRALSEGGLQGKEVLKDELQKVIADYPDHEVSDFARNVVKEIYNMAPELQQADTREKAEQIYLKNTQGKFYFGVAVTNAGDVNQMNFNLINFNLDNFNRLNLGIRNETIGSSNVLFIRSFADLQSAERYLEAFMKNTGVFNSLDAKNFRPFLISESNYQILRKDMDFEKYYLFYQKYYQQ